MNGKPRNVDQVYLDKVDDLVAMRQGALTPTTLRTRHFGAVAALWRLAGDLDLVATIDRHCPQPGNHAPSVGTYLVLAAINRVVSPRSKRGFAEWYETTALRRICGISPDQLSSQDFWQAMDRVPEAAPGAIMGEVAQKALAQLPLGDEVVAFECTSFFTWIDSGSSRPQMPRRGHNKAHRYDLRQVGLTLATTVHSEMPLFNHVYAGNSPDVTIFREAWPRLEERLQQLGLGAATAVYDTGNVSVVNQRQVDKSGISYVTSVPPSQHRELLAAPLASFQLAAHPRLSGIRYSAGQQMILRRQRLVVQTHSPTLASGQLAGLRQHLVRAQAALSELQAMLQRGSRRKPPDPETLRHEIDGIISAQHLRQVVTTKLEADAQNRPQLQFAVDEERVTHLVDHLFGRRLWITNHLEWEPERVILAARGQSEAEDAFRQLHAERAVAWSPMWHWTDQKIQVHGLYCVLGLMLVRLLQHRAAAVADTREPQSLIADLDEVTESPLIYPAAGGGRGRPRTAAVISETTPRQQSLLEATGALAIGP
ncbi:MAG: IS1634 family transposase [Candidatus Dormibacteria bacterium]